MTHVAEVTIPLIADGVHSAAQASLQAGVMEIGVLACCLCTVCNLKIKPVPGGAQCQV
jgi:hypothetical protein